MISEELIQRMKAEYMSSDISITALCKKYGVAKTSMLRITRKECWQTLRDQLHGPEGPKPDHDVGPALAPVIETMEQRAQLIADLTAKASAKVQQLLDLDEPLSPRDLKSITSAIADIKMLTGVKTADERKEIDLKLAQLEKNLDEDKTDKNIEIKFVDMEF